jgi:hypothetical protein
MCFSPFDSSLDLMLLHWCLSLLKEVPAASDLQYLLLAIPAFLDMLLRSLDRMKIIEIIIPPGCVMPYSVCCHILTSLRHTLAISYALATSCHQLLRYSLWSLRALRTLLLFSLYCIYVLPFLFTSFSRFCFLYTY